MIGVDIDDTLVRAAWRRRRAVWSLQSSSENIPDDKAGALKRQLTQAGQPDYFPISCEHEFGSLPVPPSKNRGKHAFPHNVSFRTADWVLTGIPDDAEHYSVVIA